MELAAQMVTFARTVQEGGFSAAARALDLTPSAVSKQISRLENRLGMRLLNRTTRQISLTEEGREFYQHCVRVLAELDEAQQWISDSQGSVKGSLRVAATVAFAKHHVLPLIPEFLERYSALQVHLEVTDRHVDLVEEGTDVAIRFTEQLTDPSLVARRLAVNRRVICAAPAYIARHGAPQTPDDLRHHNCLRLYTVSTFNEWEFEEPEGARILDVPGNFETNSADALYHAALAGVGIARLSTFLIEPDLNAGRLVALLPEYIHEKASILAVFPKRQHLSPKVRVFIDFLVEKFTPIPPWEARGSDAGK